MNERSQVVNVRRDTTRDTARWARFAAGLLAAGTLLATPVAGSDSDIARLKLRAEVTVCSDVVTLGDVLEFGENSEPLAEQLARQPVAAGDGAPTPTAVMHEQIVKRLNELGVNLSRVLLGGALRCQIMRQAVAPPGAYPGDDTPLLRAMPPEDTSGPRSLARVLRAHADTELADLGGTAETSFERAGQEFLQLTTPPWEFHVTSADRDKIGLRTFHVAVRRDGQLQRKVDVSAQVRLVRPVVVARRPLNPGNFVRSDDVALETRVFDQGVSTMPARIEEVVGQQIKRFVAAGGIVAADSLKAADLVVRARPVTVTGDSAGIQVRLAGIALDSGGYGDTIRVRLGDSRRERKMLRGVVTGLGTVRLAEGNLP
jgi:flagella basal body P-ring formation protein FlgA